MRSPEAFESACLLAAMFILLTAFTGMCVAVDNAMFERARAAASERAGACVELTDAGVQP